MSEFKEIAMFDLDSPRKGKQTKKTGYYWTPSEPGRGRGFYVKMNTLAMDKQGSTINLRLEHAQCHIGPGSKLFCIDGYYCDEFGDGDTLKPIIARLPSGRGFMAGWYMGFGMCGALAPFLYESEREAALAAHDIANQEAMDSIEEARRERELENKAMEAGYSAAGIRQ